MIKRDTFFLSAVLASSIVRPVFSVPSGVSSSISPPTLNAKLTFGFNYDILRAPTDVSFDYAKGNLGFNFPLEQNGLIPKKTASNVWSKMSNQISQDTSNGQQFRPQASAKQYANTTIRVDVPMLGGVASFSNIENVYLDYTNVLGNSTVKLGYDTTMKSSTGTQSVALFLLGTINVPIEATLGWETMTFGYAYKVNNDLVMAMNVHRHLFRIDMLAKMDADILGHVTVQQSPESGENSGGGVSALGGNSLSLEKDIDYPHQRLFGQANGHYEAEAWSYSLGLKLWRFTLTSRFGVDTKAHGTFTADYRVPTGIIDKQTFQVSPDLQDPQKIISSGLLDDLQQGKTDSVIYKTHEDASWKLPSGHTITFDLVRDKVSFSYTKVFGDIEMYHAHAESLSTGGTKKVVDLDVGITVDNIIMLNASFYSAFLNLGMFTMDIRVNDQKHVLGNAFTNAKLNKLKWGDAAMLPVLNFGAALGAKTQLGFEFDLLPLPAFKTGVVYHF